METVAVWGLTCGFMFVAGVTAMALLGVRDAKEAREREERRPLDDRIRDIRESAAFMIKELPRAEERAAVAGRSPVPWIPAVIDYYRRLEELAGRPTATAEEALALAEEASRFEREQKVKGLFVGGQARQLAALLQRRGPPPTSQTE